MTPTVPLPPGAVPWDRGFEVTTADGKVLRAALWAGGERGVALLLAGRTEFLEKIALTAAGLVERGFSVVGCDWRGQGLSQRLAEPAIMGHVAKFTDYHLDLKALLAAPEVTRLGPVGLMLAHSMGGAIGLGAVYRGIAAPRAVVLSAPMLGLALPPALRLAGFATVRIARLIGRLDRRPPFGDADTPYVFRGFEGNALTSDRAVFDWMAAALRANPDLRIAAPSLRWLDEAGAEMRWLSRQGRLATPAAIVTGDAETVVDRRAIDRAAGRIGAETIAIAGARHEVLIESEPMRGRAWAAIDAFLARYGV